VSSWLQSLLMFSLLFSGSLLAQERQDSTAYIAIIIDDMGHHLHRGERAIELPAMLTYSILPHTEYARVLAEMAHQGGKEVMLHMPMANLGEKPLGPGGLTPHLTEQEFYRTLDRAIQQVPHLKGVNNHMGSQLTQQNQQMNWLMAELKQRQLYFIDSRTTANTVALNVAKARHLQASSRDVFLDNDQTFTGIDEAFKALLAKAHRDGTGIAIAHPYPATLDYLTQAIPELAQQAVEVISVSALLKRQHAQNLRGALGTRSANFSAVE
jgi:uncharacterized protein